jgi:Rrf2 family transcriptional regulator, nitric oxide-sensitive transcriptional repressor
MEVITRNADYAIRALAALAGQKDAPLSLRLLAAEAGVPEDFLRKIAQQLAAAGFITSSRGRNGGLALAKRPEAIKVLAVLRALDAAPVMNRCLADSSACARRKACGFHAKLRLAQRELNDFFGALSLADIGWRGIERKQ